MSVNVAKPISSFLLLGVLCLGWICPSNSYAQRALRQTADPAVEQTLQRAGRNATEMGKAISALTRMGEFEQVDQLLSSLSKRGYDDGQKTAVAMAITASQRLRVVTHGKMSPESTKAIDDLFSLKAKQLWSPARLSQAIGALLSNNPDQTLPAMRILFEGGEASTAALVTAIVNSDSALQREYWLKAMLRIDRDSGIAALKRLSLYGTEGVRDSATAALIRLGGGGFTTELITALHRNDGKTPVTRDRVVAAFDKKRDAIPSEASVVRELRDRLVEANRVAAQSVREFGRVDAWVIDEQRRSVQLQRMPAWTLAFRDAADAAARLIAVGDNDPESLLIQMNALLAYQVTNDPDWGDEEQVNAFYEQNIVPILSPPSATAGEDKQTNDYIRRTPSQIAETVLQALEHAVATKNDPAALGVIRLIDLEIAPWSDWLVQSGGSVSTLVSAIDHPHPTVRYEAAAAIAALRPNQPYAGSVRVRDRLTQMSLLSDRGTAIILENRPEVVSAWERLMNQAGLSTTFVSTARQLERVAATGDDVRLIISKREPKDASAVEVIDLVRRISLTRDVPILIATDPPNVANEPFVEIEEPIIAGGVEMTEADKALAAEYAATLPDKHGVIGGIENIEGIIEKELLYGDLDIDSTSRRDLDMQVVGMDRWQDESLRAGLIRQFQRPKSVAGLYGLLLDSRRHQHLPPLSPVDRVRYRQIAIEALAGK